MSPCRRHIAWHVTLHALLGQDLVDEMGCQLREFSWPDYWYVGREGRLFDSNTEVCFYNKRSPQPRVL